MSARTRRGRRRAGRRRAVAASGLVAAALLLASCAPRAGAATADEPLLVAAAADLMPAFSELAESFERETGEQVTFSFGSSGQLAQQIIEGAPMDLYASASSAFVNRVLAAGVGLAATQETYAHGRIVLWARADAWGGWSDLRALAGDEAVTAVAIANPEHAPYGLAARQAMESAGAWDALEPKLVFGENVADAQRLAASGNADAVIGALSLALAADSAGEARWVLVDDRLHAPLQQDLVVVSDDPARAALAQRFIDHVASPEGREVMRRFGFLLPGEAPPEAWGD